MTKDFFTDSGIIHNVFVVRDVALTSAALKSVFVVKTTFLPALRWQYIVKLEEGKVFYIGPLFFAKEAALGDLRCATKRRQGFFGWGNKDKSKSEPRVCNPRRSGGAKYAARR
jgi:hypothetical protein